jgi:hypothetical protein
MTMSEKELLETAPDGTECVTTVTAAAEGLPAIIINSFIEDESGGWKSDSGPVRVPMVQLPELIGMLEAAFDNFFAELGN